MKKQLSFFLILISFSFGSFAQNNLTLKQAVMEQYTQLYPKHIAGFQWMKSADKYSFLKHYKSLYVGSVKKKAEEVLTISKVNSVLSSDFSYFANLTWKDGHTFLIYQKNTIAIFDIDSKTGHLITLPKDAANLDFTTQLDKVAYTIDNNLYYSSLAKFKQQAVTSNTDKNIVSGQTIAREEMGIVKGTFWSPKGDQLAFYQKDESAVANYPLVDIDTYPASLKSIKYPMNGQPSEKPKVGIYNLSAGTTSFITTRHGKDFYLTNLAWTPSENYILLAEITRSQQHLWFQRYTAKGKYDKTLFEEKSDTWVNPTISPRFPSNKSDNFVWVSERDGFNNLYYYSIEGNLIAQLTKNKFVLKSIVATHNGDVFFTATGKSPLNTLFYKVDTKGNQQLLTPEEGTHQVSINFEDGMLFDQYSAHDVPHRAVIRKSNGKIIKEVLNAKNPLADYGISSPTIKTIKDKAGVDLYTRMIKPKNFDPTKKYPVLVYVYGGPHVQLITNRWLNGSPLWMYWLANQGYIVYTLDNRGSGNRGVKFEHAIYKHLGVKEHLDQMVGVKYLKSLHYVDSTRLAVFGWSFGGFMAGTCMLRTPNVFNVGVSGGPVTDWKYYEVMYGERYMSTEKKNPEGFKQTSLINQAKNLKGKYLIINGSVDPIVMPQNEMKLIQKFIDLGIQFDYFVYPMHVHNVRGKDRVHLMTKVLDYIMQYNHPAK